MSSHPGTIVKEMIIDLPQERNYTLKRSSAFQDYKEDVMTLLRDEFDSLMLAA